jgi:RNA polymerase sigma-70 factor (ECF subfamily)
MKGQSREDSPREFSDEKDLIAQLRQIDEAAISWVWHTYYTPLLRYATGMTHNPGLSEEVVSSVFERLLEILHRGKGPKKNIKSYLYRMTYNGVVDSSRSKTESSELTEAIPEEKKSPEEFVEQGDRVAAINRALSSLTDDQRNLVLLRFVEGLTMRETAEVMSKTINAIKTMQQRAVKSLRKTPEFKDMAKEYE